MVPSNDNQPQWRSTKRKLQLQEHIDQQEYDKNYQDIEVLDFAGYSNSRESWSRISNFGIDWQGKVVCDLGCFHAYFGIKAHKEGAKKVIGLDTTLPAIETARLIVETVGIEMEFLHWSAGEDVPACDIVLCLNMLHHCPDQERTLSKMDCGHAVFRTLGRVAIPQREFGRFD
jgi:2-polyprenyl-3-methyl-5-hydroxy-6-metoxy-1,4-benzoquinol methylase